MRSEMSLQDRVSGAIKKVESEDTWHLVDQFWYNKRVNVGFGPADTSDGDSGLSCQLEVVDASHYLDLDQLEYRETTAASLGGDLAKIDAEVREAIIAATDQESIDPFIYIGGATGLVESAVFDTTVREAE